MPTGLTHAHYIGLVPPHCSLRYGVAPCRAQLSPANFIISAVQFNGEYATRGGGLTGAADSKQCTCNFWFRLDSVAADVWFWTGSTTLAGGVEAGVTMRTFNSPTPKFSIDFWNSAGTKFANIQAATPLVANNWYHCLWSVDFNNPTTNRHLYMEDVNDIAVAFIANDTIDFTIADWGFGARPNGGDKWTGAFAEFWLAPGVYLDLSIEANRRKFTAVGPRPFGLGSIGDIPTGASPKVWFRSDGSIANNGTGGTFTTAGAGVEAVTAFQTGDTKCFNTLGTCQDVAQFTDDAPVLYFGEDVSFYDDTFFGFAAFPFIRSIDFQSPIISLGDNMGQRGSITVTMRDGLTTDLPDTYFDKYKGERGYESITFGTFWGRFRARNPYMRFQPLYLFTTDKTDGGGDTNVETRAYLVESISGPDNNGEVKITAKDVLKVADGDFAKAPVQSPGFLSADITNVATTATMAPSGAINSYPSSGYLCIGGNEIVSYTKTGGDNFSMTRAQLGTVASAHTAQDRLQLVLRYAAQSPDLIIADLLTTYAGISSGLIDSAAWAAEVSGYLGTLYTLVLTEPTNVNDLVSEMILQVGAAIWWDDVNSQIRFQILREISTTAERWNEDNTIKGSLTIQDQESKRVTEVQVYFAQINPTLKIDEKRNYASVATVNDAFTESMVGGKTIKTIFARGIASGGRTVAERLAQKYLSRYVVPPRKFTLELAKRAGQNPRLGGGFILGGDDLLDRYIASPFQNVDGYRTSVPIQVTRVNPVGFTYKVEAEEMLFTAFGADIDPTNHTIIFDVSRLDVNLQTIHDGIFAAAVSGDTVNCYVNSGVIIGSSSISSPAFTVGSFVGGVTVNIFVNGRIEGKGGNGGRAAPGGSHSAGQAGGTALYTRQTCTVTNNSEIWGGGGGGGASKGIAGGAPYFNSGGGGAGSQPGDAGICPPPPGVPPGDPGFYYTNPGGSGTTEAGGDQPIGGAGGDGGGPGLAGQNATGGGTSVTNTAGGAAGTAVDGTSFVTYAATGDRRGALIN